MWAFRLKTLRYMERSSWCSQKRFAKIHHVPAIRRQADGFCMFSASTGVRVEQLRLIVIRSTEKAVLMHSPPLLLRLQNKLPSRIDMNLGAESVFI